ncbi:hypothetical protein B9G98_04470 [Wickerhamiella sorbophila]|uniref:Uncharacterized protein n=1 Tax=Wickerhamiella sorbophila TaxID=45607 RepID=A0A2T0FPD4_9ASCO|nr:hypothetical protein B9G98_04470 [Wickerhamiella sorbophila]PRT56850.1 hypothetical protein B9G98_04470 [Wickerhamiella sorbophila]
MLFKVASLASLFALTTAAQVVYNSNFTKGFVQDSNGNYFTLSVPIKQISASDVQSLLTPISAPPDNSQLVVTDDGTLMAVWGNEGCKNSPIYISEYSESADSWTQIAQSSGNWYLEGAVVWCDWSADVIYYYGGDCNGKITRDFYGYNVSSGTFGKASASPMPREMAYAQAITLDRTSTVMVGGKANNGWLSMQQVAFWEYKSWTYRSVSDFSGIDSRDSPLVLPLWLATGNEAPVVTQLLVIGGTVNNRAAKPDCVMLEFNNTDGWAWSKTSIDADGSFLTLYDSLVNFQNGVVSMFDGSSNWQKAQVIPIPSATATISPGSYGKSASKFNTASIATLSTVIPVIIIVIALGGGFWWWRKRKQRLTFQPRTAQLSSPDMASIGFDMPPQFSSQFTSPYRSTHNETLDENNSVSDVQFLVSNRRQALRVVNPDAESINDVASHRRNRSGQSHVSGHTRSKSSCSNIIRSETLENPFDDKFDFELKS